METKDKTQIAILVLIAILIATLIAAIVVLSKNADEIRNNPVKYSIDNGFYESCYCRSGDGVTTDFLNIDGETSVYSKDEFSIDDIIVKLEGDGELDSQK